MNHILITGLGTLGIAGFLLLFTWAANPQAYVYMIIFTCAGMVTVIGIMCTIMDRKPNGEVKKEEKQ